ncbi:hypothetical protein AKJ41_00360 [candidate division MSBL1 archaeon SCGC-AAA259O05]|uniref:Uncharacterized protein n=1 Tax=candidate division MSBL1 archaeon SCGC-AAA259O05 TaxID=1698271 RepID=A0A133V5R0_9EURY|nr:hypothetical protein AKJ41_00360 [candidate division MSBL1 archaeon SCGC-AAA259O05]
MDVEKAKKMELNVHDMREEKDLWRKIWGIYLRTNQVLQEEPTKVWATRNQVLIKKWLFKFKHRLLILGRIQEYNK